MMPALLKDFKLKERENAGFKILSGDGEESDRDGKVKATRAGAAGVEVKDAVASLL